MLEARDLDCERGGRALFRKVGFSVEGGALLRIAGANGSGKTSLLRILCGLLPPSAGEVRWKDLPIGSLREEYSRHLVYLGHAPAVKDDLTAAENLEITCRLAGFAAKTDDALAKLGVPADVPVRRRGGLPPSLKLRWTAGAGAVAGPPSPACNTGRRIPEH